jgi:hypothetical protein
MQFINALNETAVTYVADLYPYWGIASGGFEAISPLGEIKVFLTWHTAHQWRVEQVKEVLS